MNEIAGDLEIIGIPIDSLRRTFSDGPSLQAVGFASISSGDKNRIYCHDGIGNNVFFVVKREPIKKVIHNSSTVFMVAADIITMDYETEVFHSGVLAFVKGHRFSAFFDVDISTIS